MPWQNLIIDRLSPKSFMPAFLQGAAKEQSARGRPKELVPLNGAAEMPPQEEMILDPRTQGIEAGKKSGRSLGLQF